jgi:cardiolipin synthase
MMNTSLPDFPLLGQNSIEPLLCGDEAFPRMLAAIAGAKDHVHLQTFIIGNDAVGRRMLDALRERAEAGVTVRLLYDRFGSTAAILSGLLRRYAGVPNFKIAGWTLANPVKRQFQINLRNHRKVLIVDGRRAFTGGVNLSANNESVPNRQPDRDYHFELCGPIVQELQYAFLGDWFCMTEEDPDRLLAEAHFPRPEPAGGALVRLINGGPASDTEILTDTFFAMIVQAEKQLYAVTPYFAPPPEIVRALRSAALRGVDVRLVVPEKSNHLYAGWAGRALYEELLDAGVRIFQRPPPFLHAKAMIVDESVALVGTANLDVRSLRLNYETNLAVFDTAFIDVLKRIVLDDVARSRELNLATWRARPTLHRVAENFCSLLTPVL